MTTRPGVVTIRSGLVILERLMATRWPFAAFGAIAILWAVSVHGAFARATSGQSTQPATAAETPPSTATETAEYVGAARCAPCHADMHQMWTHGRHSKMLQAASPVTVVGDFSQGGLTLNGRHYRVSAHDGAFFVTESELNGKEREHRVEYTLGSRRIQHYLTTRDNGEIIVLPTTWDVQRREWFHNREIIRPDENDGLIVQQWNRNCVGCHVSGQENNYDPVARTYRTEWMDFGTSCERCHGPGLRHAEGHWTTPQQARASIVRPTRLDSSTNSMVCAQCHSARTAINPGFTAGADYYDFFIPALEYGLAKRKNGSQDPVYWADGRPRRFSNDAIGLWQSACFLRGGVTCTTCHTNPHLPNIERNPQLAGTASDALCTGCHQPIASKLAEHTRHPASSSGSRCVECHMPKTVVSIKATMRDHTMSVPAPENTVKFGIPNACTECHRDKPASWAVSVLRSWWPDGRRQRLIAQAEAFTAARASRTEAIDPLIAIAESDAYPPLIRANAIGYLGRFDDSRASSAVIRAARHELTPIRLSAVAALRGPTAPSDAARTAVLSALSDRRRSVRIAAALTVAERHGRDLRPEDRPRIRAVGRELALWIRRHQDDSDLQSLQGVVHLLGGDFGPAATALAISLDHAPESTYARFMLGLARLGQGRAEEARRLFKQIPRGDRYYASAQEQLRNLASH